MQQEEERRRDFRDECVVSIDPATARVSQRNGERERERERENSFDLLHSSQDLDDALHCKELEPGAVIQLHSEYSSTPSSFTCY